MHRRLSIMLALAVLSTSCDPAVPASPTPQAHASVVRFAWEDVGTPTPFRISTAGPGGAVMLTLLYDTLTWKDEHGVIPWLATRWDVSPDGLEYTFNLAPGVTFHDGQPLTAADVAFSFGYYARHPYRWVDTTVVESATAIGSDQVRIRLQTPYAPFLEDIAGTRAALPPMTCSRSDSVKSVSSRKRSETSSGAIPSG
jgi:peptide/nickel transport system substrate-binding protein